MREYTTHEEEEERGEVKVKSKYRVQTVWHLGGGVCERELGDSSGLDEFDVSRFARLQSLQHFY